MILDFITGVRKASLRGEATTSRGFRRTAEKASQYFLPMMCLTAIDVIASIYLDYSVLLEYAGTPVFDDLLKLLAQGLEVYVSKSFKALHYCTLRIKDPKDRNTALAMKKICSALLAEHKMHLIKELETYKVAANITGISDGMCILTTRKSLFTKRLYEKRPDYGCDIAVITDFSLQVFDSVDSLLWSYPQPEPSKLAFNDSYIESFGNASISDVVVTEKLEKYELTKRLSGGAEGMVFLTDRDNRLAKIYHKGIINPLRWAKLKKLTELGITGQGFCIPLELLFFRKDHRSAHTKNDPTKG